MSNNASILVVEDEPAIMELLRVNLVDAGYDVRAVADAEAAEREIARAVPTLVLLDWMLPRKSGLAFARELRTNARTRLLPIIMVTARTDEADKVAGLEAWVDDYVTKPFSPRELATRVKTVLRRSAPSALTTSRIEVEGLVIEPEHREATRNGARLRLTAKEFDLLCFLASHPNRVFGRDQLMRRVWGYEAAVDSGTITVHVRRLREKIEEDPSHPRLIETVWGVGYRFRS